jgi:hypothetical protein
VYPERSSGADMQPPNVLYKYYPPERLDFFETLQVRFSSPSQMNDAFDSHFLVPTDLPRARTARLLWRDKMGILSLTERPDNHLMWVHYAKNHTGFVVGFDAHADFFQQDNRVLRKVEYKTGPDVLPQGDIEVCFAKANDWEYEKEWRCVREFVPTESRMVSIHPSLVVEVIFGSQMQTWQISRIIQALTQFQMFPRTKLFQARPSRTEWVVEIRPRELILCPHCEGDGFVARPPLLS